MMVCHISHTKLVTRKGFDERYHIAHTKLVMRKGFSLSSNFIILMRKGRKPRKKMLRKFCTFLTISHQITPNSDPSLFLSKHSACNSKGVDSYEIQLHVFDKM